MTAHSTAKGIASLGRHGDDMIVHMSRDEVKGLQALAQQHGTSLTINPHTGMPEAFKLGRILGAIAPMAIGFALGPGGFGLGNSIFGANSFLGSSLGTGLLVGGATAALTGNLGKGLMAGLGAYGGSELSSVWDKMGGFSGAGGAAANNAAAIKAGTGVTTVGLPESTGNLLTAAPYNTALVSTPATTGINTGLNVSGTYSPALTTATKTAASTGIAPTATNQGTFWERLTKSIGTPEKPATGGEVAMKVLPSVVQVASGAGAFDEPTYTNQYGTRMKRVLSGTYDAQGNPEYKYVPAESYAPTETLNTTNPYANYGYMTPPPALQLKAEGGEIKSYAIGGAIDNNASSSAGISDLYNRPEGQTMENLSQDGYGIGRLNNLANAEAMNTARITGYAMGGLTALKQGGQPGGYLDGPGDGMSDSIPATIEGKQPARLADGEFVVPADVVSHLGNGSTKAGSKRLYAMLDKVRQARTGTKKQGRQINPNKFLPA